MTKIRVAIQGVTGCYHEAAARGYFANDEVETIHCTGFRQLFETTAADRSLLGIVAIENTIAGSLLQNHELLRRSNMSVIGEHKLHISHVLAALDGQSVDDIYEVNSHPIALMQCEEWLKAHPKIKVVEKSDTASAAHEIAEQHLTAHAAICGELAANIYGLNILERGIETNKRNFTRFLLLADSGVAARYVNPQTVNKASLVFSLPHTQGSLSKVLTILLFYDVNLTKIQSLPIIGREWEYLFYVDVTFADIERYRQAIDAVRPLTNEFKTLGEYAETESEI